MMKLGWFLSDVIKLGVKIVCMVLVFPFIVVGQIVQMGVSGWENFIRGGKL